jgi:hypothetical protein
MATLNDLRAVLLEGERYAGDPDAVLQTVNNRRGDSQHHDAYPGHPRRVWVAAGAVVAMLAVVAALVGVSSDREVVSRKVALPSAVRTSGPTSTRHSTSPGTGGPVPANALRWSFTVGPVPGFTFAYLNDQPEPSTAQQTALLVSNTNPNLTATVTVYPPGAFDPNTGSVDGTAVNGAPVSVNGHPGTFVAGPSTPPTLFWTYASNAWATVGTSGTTTGRALAQTVADAVRPGTSAPVTLPFQLGTLPPPLKILAVLPRTDQSSIVYGTSLDPVHGIYLTVTRMSAARAALLAHKHISEGPGSRIVNRTLPDRSVLRVAVEPNHLDDISQAQLNEIAAAIDVSPTLGEPSTWLPVLH